MVVLFAGFALPGGYYLAQRIMGPHQSTAVIRYQHVTGIGRVYRTDSGDTVVVGNDGIVSVSPLLFSGDDVVGRAIPTKRQGNDVWYKLSNRLWAKFAVRSDGFLIQYTQTNYYLYRAGGYLGIAALLAAISIFGMLRNRRATGRFFPATRRGLALLDDLDDAQSS